VLANPLDLWSGMSFFRISDVLKIL
jgi:hypothetical protein